MATLDPTRLVFGPLPAPGPGPARLVFGETPTEAVLPVDPAVRLVFGAPAVATPGTVRLVFGASADAEGPAEEIPDATLQGAGTLTGLRLRIALGAGLQLSGVGRITGLRLRVAVRYDVNVKRATVGGARTRWQNAVPLPLAAGGAWQQAVPLAAGTRSHWQDAATRAALLRAGWQAAQQLQRAACTRYQQAERLSAAPLAGRFEESVRLRHAVGAGFEQAYRVPGTALAGRYQETLRDRQVLAAGAFEVAHRMAAAALHRMGIAVRTPAGMGGRYQQAWPPRPGRWLRPPIPPLPDPCYDRTLPVHLVFASGEYAASLPAHLVFVCERHGPPGPQPEPGNVVVPIRRVYVTINSIILTRVSDGMPLPADSFSMSLDTDSWTWQWSASLQSHLLPYLAPVDGSPVQVQAVVNGVPYRLCAESLTRDRSFGQSRIAVRGRGLGAALDAPYAPTLNFGNDAGALTAQQLMAAALTINGVGIGWDVDFGLTDWLVPAGAWSHQGTYLSAITTIAAAAGGYVQPHATLQTLRILPRYPAPPWEWASVVPDFALPADVVSVEGIEWTTKPAYTRVHVSGQAQGVLAEVTRAGTAGTAVAPMVTDALITHADAARQRGLAVLADTGAQARVTLTLPVLPETGLILPGHFVSYSDGPVQRKGIVRGSSVNWSRPRLRQTLQLETHGSD